MINSNLLLCFCATALIFLNNADALNLNIPGIINVQIGGETHPYTSLTCPYNEGGTLYRCVRQVNRRSFVLGPEYYSSGDEFCQHLIVCNYNGVLTPLEDGQYPPNGTPCDVNRPTSACYKRRCLPAAQGAVVQTCDGTGSSIDENA